MDIKNPYWVVDNEADHGWLRMKENVSHQALKILDKDNTGDLDFYSGKSIEIPNFLTYKFKINKNKIMK